MRAPWPSCRRCVCTQVVAKARSVTPQYKTIQQWAAGSKFPWTGSFVQQHGLADAADVVSRLQPLISEARLNRMRQVIAQRTFSVLPVVEGLYSMGNLGAVCRSADALGLGAVHCINSARQHYKSRGNRNSAGAEKWMDVRLWDSTADCLQTVKSAGFQLVVTHLTEGSVDISSIDWSRPTAVLFGNERDGVTEEALSFADHLATVPMCGFSDSYNVSVAAALTFYEARSWRMRNLGAHADLSQEEQESLMAIMMLRHRGEFADFKVFEGLLNRARGGGEPVGIQQSRAGNVKRPSTLTTAAE